jgi:hypothetical protein
VTLEQENTFEINYQLGKRAFEKGEYRQSIEFLKAASQQVIPSTAMGGEVMMWLVTAYQANGQQTEAIALCQKLTTHPDFEIRKQAKNLLYIIQAPQLQRPKEWMVEIPDLTQAEESDLENRRGAGLVKPQTKSQPKNYDLIDLSEVETKDNQFIWFALVIIIGFGFLLIKFS